MSHLNYLNDCEWERNRRDLIIISSISSRLRIKLAIETDLTLEKQKSVENATLFTKIIREQKCNNQQETHQKEKHINKIHPNVTTLKSR